MVSHWRDLSPCVCPLGRARPAGPSGRSYDLRVPAGAVDCASLGAVTPFGGSLKHGEEGVRAVSISRSHQHSLPRFTLNRTKRGPGVTFSPESLLRGGLQT
jgi:hypothetical protein